MHDAGNAPMTEHCAHVTRHTGKAGELDIDVIPAILGITSLHVTRSCELSAEVSTSRSIGFLGPKTAPISRFTALSS